MQRQGYNSSDGCLNDERLGGESELMREAIETIQPTLCTAKDGRIEVQQLASSYKLSLLV